MLKILTISIFCFLFVSVKGQDQTIAEKKIPHLQFPYAVVEKTTVEFKSSTLISDTDNDGVLDEFDKEINSPQGFPVDVFGVTMDSDNDGCLDFEDMEPFSSPVIPIENCVNVIGGECDPKSKSESLQGGTNCMELPMIFFEVNSINIGKEDIPVLNQAVEILKRYPQIKLNVSGSINNTENEDLIKEREKAVIEYLMIKGISEDKFMAGKSTQIDWFDMSFLSQNVAFYYINTSAKYKGGNNYFTK